MPPKRKSLVWKFYQRIDDRRSKCELCEKEIRTNRNTANLRRHIRIVHKSAYSEIDPLYNNSSEAEKITSSFGEPIGNETDTDCATPLHSTSSY